MSAPTRPAAPTRPGVSAPAGGATSAPTRRGKRRRGHRLVTLTGRGTAVGALGAVAVAAGAWAHYPGAVGLGLALLAAVLVSAFGLLARRSIQVRRLLPAGPVRRLSPLTVRVELANPAGHGTADVTVVEHVAGQALPPNRITVAGGRSQTLDCPLDTALPGPLSLGPLTLTHLGLAGLARMRQTHDHPDEVDVLARRLPVRLPDTGAVPQDRLQPDEVDGLGTELRSLRRYTAGDDIRRVNARISARFGELMIRQDSEPAISAVTVLLDNRPGLEPARYAEMLDVATSVTAAAALAGLPTAWGGRAGRVVPVGPADLAVTEIALARSSLAAGALPRTPSADLTVVVTGGRDTSADVPGDVLAHGDHRLLVVLAVAGADTSSRPGGRGLVVVTAPSAEECLHRFSALGRARSGAPW